MRIFNLNISTIVFLISSLAMSQSHEDSHKEIDPAFKALPLALSGLTALEQFVNPHDHEHFRADEPLKWLGFSASKAEKEIEVGVYSPVSNTQLEKHIFGCHLEKDAKGEIDGAHCHDEQEKETISFESFTPKYSLNDISAALILGIQSFGEGDSVKVSQIEKLKVWQSKRNIEVKFSWTNEAKESEFRYLSCHFHGKELDCHVEEDQPSSEPQD